MKEHNIMKIKLFLLAAFGAVLSLSGCRPEQDGPSEDRTVYREVAVSLGQADEEPGTRSLVSIDIEHFQKAALFAFDPQTGELRNAILLRVLPLSELEQKWVFPQEEFENAEPSIIDADGDYIIKGHSFKNSSFFEFYRSYNATDPASVPEIIEKTTS